MGALVSIVSILSMSCPFPRVDAVVPVRGEVIGRYVAPSCERCAGRRGVLVGTIAGDTVRATRDGAITFAGRVGGAHFVVQQVAAEVRVTYGRLLSIADHVRTGVMVGGGTVLGTVAATTHLGVRVGSRYADPLWCWAGRPRLVESIPSTPGPGSR